MGGTGVSRESIVCDRKKRVVFMRSPLVSTPFILSFSVNSSVVYEGLELGDVRCHSLGAWVVGRCTLTCP